CHVRRVVAASLRHVPQPAQFPAYPYRIQRTTMSNDLGCCLHHAVLPSMGHSGRATTHNTFPEVPQRSRWRPAMSSTKSQRRPGPWVRMRQNLGGEMMAEFLGTFIL